MKSANSTGVLNEGVLTDRCAEGAMNRKVRVPMTDGKATDGTVMTGLPDIPANKYAFTGGKVNQ